MGWLGDKLLSLFMEKSARERIKAHHKATKEAMEREATEQEQEAISELDAAIQRMRDRQTSGKGQSTEKAALIRQAMAIHRSKQSVLAELSPEDREKLMAMAAKAFLAEVPDRKH